MCVKEMYVYVCANVHVDDELVKREKNLSLISCFYYSFCLSLSLSPSVSLSSLSLLSLYLSFSPSLSSPPLSLFLFPFSIHIVPTGPPLSVILSAAGGSHLYINWSPPLAGERNGPITHYVIYYENNSTNSIMTHSAITYNETSIVLNELQYGSMYSVWVQAWNSIGGGPNSSEMYYSTLNCKCVFLAKKLLIL